MTRISSRDNSLIKDCVRLSGDKNHRLESGRFILEGVRLTDDALKSGIVIESAFLTADALTRHGEIAERLSDKGVLIYEITQPVAQKLADTQNTQGVFCTALMLDKMSELNKIDINGAYLALENIQDPGNLGTMLRAAEALGLDGVILSADCADVYAPKVLRAAMGASFRLPFMQEPDLPELLKKFKKSGMTILAAVADGAACSILEVNLAGGVVAAVGNEGSGLTKRCLDACSHRVTIPMKGRAESLNAASAASILMWEIMRNRN